MILLDDTLYKINVRGNHERYIEGIRLFLGGMPLWRCAKAAGLHHNTLKRVLFENDLIDELAVTQRKKDETFNDWGDWVYPPPRPWD